MIVQGLDGKEYKWKIKSGKRQDTNKSKLHLEARDLLKELFPYDIIHEEITIPGTKVSANSKSLCLDFFIPNRTLAVEVNGEQHFNMNSFHYKTKHDFFKALARDRNKINWCMLNSITLVSLDYNDKHNWRERIINR